MQLEKNQFGVPQFPPGDARRLFVLLSAVDLLERPTLATIADMTSYDKNTIDVDLAKLQEQYGVALRKIGDVYRIESWGDVLNKAGVTRFLKA